MHILNIERAASQVPLVWSVSSADFQLSSVRAQREAGGDRRLSACRPGAQRPGKGRSHPPGHSLWLGQPSHLPQPHLFSRAHLSIFILFLLSLLAFYRFFFFKCQPSEGFWVRNLLIIIRFLPRDPSWVSSSCCPQFKRLNIFPLELFDRNWYLNPQFKWK